jgi:4-hydroxybenzoate polyprenyltransferase
VSGGATQIGRAFERAEAWLSLVRFSHSIFALPFAALALFVASGGWPDPRVALLVVSCCVAARTAAMGANRLVDAKIDAENPRTAQRELPSGKVRPASALLLTLLSAAVFVAGAFALSPLCGWISLPVLALLVGYSYTKRFTYAAHFVLGACLALAPLGAWLAAKGSFEGPLQVPLWLAAGVWTWVAGFDLIYACQDVAFDARRGLHSVPARFGVPFALGAARVLHALTVVCWIAFARAAGLGWGFGIALASACVLLVWEHRLVRPRDLSRVDVAFFTLNGWVSVLLFVGGAVDLTLVG